MNVEELSRLKEIYSDDCVNHYSRGERVAQQDFFLQETDVLIPGARPDTISMANVDAIKSKFIVPIANIAAVESIENKLHERGVVYVPGFVSNCGGILFNLVGYLLREPGYDNESILDIFKIEFLKKVKLLITNADHKNKSISQAAREISWSNFQQMRDTQYSILKKITIKMIKFRICQLLLRRKLVVGSNFILRKYIEYGLGLSNKR